MENNSQGIRDEGIERKRVFFEGFEDDDVQISISNVSDSILSPNWTIETNPQEFSKFPVRPSAYNGYKSLQLSAKRVSEKAVSQFCFTIPEVIECNMLRIKLYANTLHPLTDSPNIIQVAYRTKDNDEWQYSEIISAEDNYWRRFVVNLPNNVLPEIHVKGTAFAGSVLAIDNIEVEEIIEKNESWIHETRFDANGIISVYSLSGIKQNHLQRGFNIIRLPNGATIKAISK